MKKLLFLASIAFLAATVHAQKEWTPYSGNPTMLPAIDPISTSIYAPGVVYHKGQYHLYYTRKIGKTVENIGHSVSNDGLTWTLVDTLAYPVSTETTRFDSEKLGQPTLISEGDTLKMWYWGAGKNGGNIGMAWSLDGKAWTRVDGAGTDKSVYDITMDGSGTPAIACPNVIKDGTGYKMWYCGVKISASDFYYVIYHATSPDGLVWTKVAGSGPSGIVLERGAQDAFDGGMAFFPSVVKDGSAYRMWYTASDTAGDFSMGYATSPDGIAWTKVPGTLAGGSVVTGATCSVMASGAGFKMWYVGGGGLSYATSGLPVGLVDKAHPAAVNPIFGSDLFDARGKWMGTPSRRFPGLSFRK